MNEFPTNNPDIVNLQCTIKDQEIGIAAEDLPYIFEPFYRGQNALEKTTNGSGLGLAIAKNTIELMGGTIDVESCKAKGTTFVINYPICICYSNPLCKLEAKEINQLKVLVCDDNEINLMIATRMMEHEDLQVTGVKNGYQAIELLKQKAYDLVFMDLHMPEIDGFQTALKTREFNQEVIIIALSANSFIDDVIKCKNSGMNDHLAKPINSKKLIQIINQYCN